MTIYSKKAETLFKSGYNCSQAVLGAFCEEIGLDFEKAVKLSSGFGGGIGRTRNICGAVTGMLMAADMLYGYSNPKAINEKKETYQMIQHLIKQFENQNGSIICKELLGISCKTTDDPNPEKRTQEYYKKRPCVLLVSNAAQILDDYIEKQSH